MHEPRSTKNRQKSGPQSSDAGGPAVLCRGLVKRYPGVTAVDGLDLEVGYGECFGLLGPNGAGKTTTIEVLEGLLEPDAGEVRALGLGWREHARELRERVGVQLQEARFSEKLTVAETVRLFRSFYRAGREVAAVLSMVQLIEKADARVGSLSGGQRQRLSLACALAGRPDLLFLDEPTTGLDPQSRRSVWELVESFLDEGGTVLLTTHYMEEAAVLCDRVGIMDRGRVIALGHPDELVASLGAEHVVEFSVENAQGEHVAATRERLEHYQALPDVRSVRSANGRVYLTVGHVHTAVPALLESLRADGDVLAGLSTHGATLEDVFVSLTGRQLRDA